MGAGPKRTADQQLLAADPSRAIVTSGCAVNTGKLGFAVDSYNQVMAPTLDEILDAFHRQAETLVDQVQQIGNAVFRKALYISMLDGLSACTYGNAMGSGDRFRTFILQIGGWTDGERISLPQAALLFRRDPEMSAAISEASMWGPDTSPVPKARFVN